MIADCLTKTVVPNEVYVKLIQQNACSLVPSQAQQEEENHRLKLRQGQRQRAKEKKAALKKK